MIMDFTGKIRSYYKTLINIIENLDVGQLNEAMNVLYDAYERESDVRRLLRFA